MKMARMGATDENRRDMVDGTWCLGSRVCLAGARCKSCLSQLGKSMVLLSIGGVGPVVHINYIELNKQNSCNK